MLINFRKASDVSSSEITPKAVFDQRRKFLATAAIAGVTLAAGSIMPPAFAATNPRKLLNVTKSEWNLKTLGEKATEYESVTRYNNFYEFGTGKTDPVDHSMDFEPLPWTVKVDGLVENPGTYDFDKLVKPHQLEERVYRMRCVEAWSMVVPWVGIPLADVIKRLGPQSGAKYVAFETLNDPERMPGQKRRVLKWPYKEGLRMDEAMNPLTLLSVGLYGEALPNQNGAPLRLVVPWKYGFKSIKSIVRISFVDEMPPTSWNDSAPSEYGFYSNVNPKVRHPRWSQAKERRIGDFLKRDTLMFNGYEEEVAGMYKDMDLADYF